jgi:ABC-type proline/glycine betaine transport system permease subunit
VVIGISFLFILIVFAIPVAIYASRKKRSRIVWFLSSILITPPLAFLILSIIGSSPTTKIRLIVLVFLILFIPCLPIICVKTRDIKAQMTEVTNAMSQVASAVTAHKQESNSWPLYDGVIAIRTSLGLNIPTKRISSITVTSPRAEEVIITATIKGIDSRVDGKNLTLTGKAWERGIAWVWGGNVPPTYVPKK